MKTIYFTLVLTLLFAIAYLGRAHAAANTTGDVIRFQNRGAAAETKQMGNKPTASKATKPLDTESLTASSKDDAPQAGTNDKVLVDKIVCEEGAKENFQVRQNKDFIFVAANSSCADCNKPMPLNITAQQLTNTGSLGDQQTMLKNLAMKALKDTCDDLKTAKNENALNDRARRMNKVKMDKCLVANEEGDEFESSEAQVACFETKINTLLESKKLADHTKALGLLNFVKELYAKDMLVGKNADTSPFIKFINDMIGTSGAPDKSAAYSDKAKYNFGVVAQAEVYQSIAENLRNEVSARIESIKKLADSGNIQQANQQILALRNYSDKFKTIDTYGAKSIALLNKSLSVDAPGFNVQNLTSNKALFAGGDGQVAAITEMNKDQNDLNNIMAKANTYVAKVATSGKKTTVDPLATRYDSILGSNSAAASASGVNANGIAATLAADSDFQRIYENVRGSINGNFQGAKIPTTSPFGNGQTVSPLGSTTVSAGLSNNTRTQGLTSRL